MALFRCRKYHNAAPWERALADGIALYVYWALAERMTKHEVVALAGRFGMQDIQDRIAFLRRRNASFMGNDTFVLSGR